MQANIGTAHPQNYHKWCRGIVFVLFSAGLICFPIVSYLICRPARRLIHPYYFRVFKHRMHFLNNLTWTIKIDVLDGLLSTALLPAQLTPICPAKRLFSISFIMY